MDLDNLYKRKPSSLLQAVRQKNIKAVGDLLRRGVGHPNSSDHRGWTPLHAAAELNQLEIVKLLLDDERTNPEASTYSGNLALNIAVESNASVEVVNCLAQRTSQFSQEEYASCLLFEAARTASPVVVQYIINNTNVDIQGNKQITEFSPVFMALFRNDEKVVEVLLDACVDVNDLFHSVYHKRTMAFAVEADCTVPIIRMLIKKGALLNFGEIGEDSPAMQRWYRTALTLALVRGKTGIVFELLKHDVDVNFVIHGCIPLVLAVELKNYEVVKALLPVTSVETLESLCEGPNSSGIICYALSHNDDDILSLLLNHNLSEPILEAPVPIRLILITPSLMYSHIGPLAFFLKERMKILGNKSMSIIKLLLSKGISIEPRKHSYVPPLVAALLTWSRSLDSAPKEVVRMLLDLGANVDHQSLSVLPDALLIAMYTENYEALSMILPYSRYTPCDILRLGIEHQKHFLGTFVLKYMIAIGDYSELSHLLEHYGEVGRNYVESLNQFGFKVTPLAVLARCKVRQCLQMSTNSSEFLNIIEKLEIPKTLKYFLRFM